MLTVRSLKSYYESICALKAVSLHIEKGEIVTLIGANGSGKSTFLNSIIGLIPRITGTILFEGKEIQGLSSYTIVKLGIALAPEGKLFFPFSEKREELKNPFNFIIKFLSVFKTVVMVGPQNEVMLLKQDRSFFQERKKSS